jgi:hypothetical protein
VINRRICLSRDRLHCIRRLPVPTSSGGNKLTSRPSQLISRHASKKSLEIYPHLSLQAVENAYPAVVRSLEICAMGPGEVATPEAPAPGGKFALELQASPGRRSNTAFGLRDQIG